MISMIHLDASNKLLMTHYCEAEIIPHASQPLPRWQDDYFHVC